MLTDYDALTSFLGSEAKRDRQLEAQGRAWEALCDMHDEVNRAREFAHRAERWAKDAGEPWDITTEKARMVAAALRDLASKVEGAVLAQHIRHLQAAE